MKLKITIEGTPGTGKILLAQRIRDMIIKSPFEIRSVAIIDRSFIGTNYCAVKKDAMVCDCVIKVVTKQPKL
jgi:broad-specificity NMP kinase